MDKVPEDWAIAPDKAIYRKKLDALLERMGEEELEALKERFNKTKAQAPIGLAKNTKAPD